MLKTKTKTIKQEVIESLVCDKCGKGITPDDIIEWQESYSINFVGGYGSVFGDMVEVTCDLCQHCLKDLIGDICLYGEA